MSILEPAGRAEGIARFPPPARTAPDITAPDMDVPTYLVPFTVMSVRCPINANFSARQLERLTPSGGEAMRIPVLNSPPRTVLPIAFAAHILPAIKAPVTSCTSAAPSPSSPYDSTTTRLFGLERYSPVHASPIAFCCSGLNVRGPNSRANFSRSSFSRSAVAFASPAFWRAPAALARSVSASVFRLCVSFWSCAVSLRAVAASRTAAPASSSACESIWKSCCRRAVSALSTNPSKTPSPTIPTITIMSPTNEAGMAQLFSFSFGTSLPRTARYHRFIAMQVFRAFKQNAHSDKSTRYQQPVEPRIGIVLERYPNGIHRRCRERHR